MDNIEKQLRRLSASENITGFSPGFSDRVMKGLPVFKSQKTEVEKAWPSLWFAFKRVSFAGAALGLVLAALNFVTLAQVEPESAEQMSQMGYSVDDVMEVISDEIYEVVF